ncbi:SWIM-type domain-containing protein, partial [Aphis craccivora]
MKTIMNNCHENFGSSSSGQWETFLHTTGQQVALKRRDSAMIKVQPISIARRSAKEKRLPTVKKKQNLGLNINLNQTNVKSQDLFKVLTDSERSDECIDFTMILI